MELEKAQKLCRTNTGRHFLDSGCAYGYKFNDKLPKNFIDEKRLLISLPHWLHYNCYDNDKTKFLTKEFLKFWDNNEGGLESITKEFFNKLIEGNLEIFAKQFFNKKFFDESHLKFSVKFIKNDRLWLNTYDFDNDLDQCFEFTKFQIGSKPLTDIFYVIIRVHTGCDIRGGYTDPVIFSVDEDFPSGCNLYGQCIKCGIQFNSVYDIEKHCKYNNKKLCIEHKNTPICRGKVMVYCDIDR